MKTFNLRQSHIASFGTSEVSSFNLFVFQMNNRLQHEDRDVRDRVIGRIITDLEDTDIFKPAYLMANDDDYHDSDAIAFENDHARDNRIKRLQAFYNVEGATDEELEQERIMASRCGKTDLHDAVSARDVDTVRKILDEGSPDLTVKDNNNYTAAQSAVIEGCDEIIELFAERGLLPS